MVTLLRESKDEDANTENVAPRIYCYHLPLPITNLTDEVQKSVAKRSNQRVRKYDENDRISRLATMSLLEELEQFLKENPDVDEFKKMLRKRKERYKS